MRAPALRQQGAGLVEIMISLVLGLVLLVAILKAYDDSKSTYRMQESLSRLQENARYAIQFIARDIRMAGYRACVRDSSASGIKNTLNTATSFLYDFQSPLQGFEGRAAGGWSPGLDASLGSVLPGTDVIAIRGTPDVVAYLSQDMASNSADLKIVQAASSSSLVAGDILLLSDCLHAAVFQVTQYTAASGNLVHNSGSNSPAPGNASKDLGYRFPAGSQLSRVATTSYFIRTGSTGPGLWRKQGSTPAQELIAGIQDMQILYGQDADGDTIPDNYLDAAAITDFRQVVALRLALLLRSPEIASTERDQRHFTLLGRRVGPFSDGRLYQAIETSITLRNLTN